MSAAANNVAVRGVNPAASDVIAVYIGSTPSDITTAFDWVLADAEQDQIYGVLNFSQNGYLYSESNPYNILSVLRRVSTRVLVVQSAGNNHQDACNEAYGSNSGSVVADGILVVGGIDENGAEAIPYDNTSVWPGFYQDGSNYAPCVEVWGPSERIKSTWNSSSTAVVSLSGTSMAAPHVAALAARFGNGSTTPVEREQWIRGKTFWTGYYSQTGQPLIVPSYTQSLSTNLSSRLFPASASADATYPGTSVNYLSDGLYLTNTWNAGHFAPAWVEFDLGSSRVITSIRAVPEQSPAGAVTHYVYAGNSPAPTTLVATLSSSNGDVMEPLASTVGTYARYVRVYTSSSPSYVAWREVEIYGY